MRGGPAAALAALILAIVCAAPALAQRVADTITATASVKTESARASADFLVTVARCSSDGDRDKVLAALRDGGSAGAQKVLSAMDDAGFIQVGGRRTAIKLAVRRPTPGGDLVTVVTSQPILFLGAGVPGAPPRAGFELAVAILEVTPDQRGVGEFAPAAKVGMGATGALLIEDYAGPVLWLNGIARAR